MVQGCFEEAGQCHCFYSHDLTLVCCGIGNIKSYINLVRDSFEGCGSCTRIIGTVCIGHAGGGVVT